MALLLRYGPARSLSRARDGPIALAGLRSPVTAPWSAIRKSSNISRDDFIEQAIRGSRENTQNEREPSSSPSTDDDSSTAQTAVFGSSPSIKSRKKTKTFRIRKLEVDPTSYPRQRPQIQQPQIQEPRIQKASEGLVRKVSVDGLRVRKTDSKTRQSEYGLLIRKYSLGNTKGSKGRRSAAFARDDEPPTVLSRPRIVVLQQLRSETTTGDIVKAIERAVDENRLPNKACRLAGVREEPRIGNEEPAAFRVEFLHPDGANALHYLVKKGHFQIGELIPTASLLQDEESLKYASDTGIGMMASREEREEYFASRLLGRAQISRTRLLYN